MFFFVIICCRYFFFLYFSPLLNHQQQIEHEPETSTDFVDALTGSGDEDFLSSGNSNENKFSFDVKSSNGTNNQVQQRNLLDLTLNNSQLELPAFGNKFVNENEDGEDVQQTSTPISDDNFDNIAQDSFVLNSNEFYSKSGEISFDSFETALSTMSDDRPISSKGQYSLDFEKLMASGDAPLETAGNSFFSEKFIVRYNFFIYRFSSLKTLSAIVHRRKIKHLPENRRNLKIIRRRIRPASATIRTPTMSIKRRNHLTTK